MGVSSKYILYLIMVTGVFLCLSFKISKACCNNNKENEEENTLLTKHSKKFNTPQTIISDQPKSDSITSKERAVSVSPNSSSVASIGIDFLNDGSFDLSSASNRNSCFLYPYWYPMP